MSVKGSKERFFRKYEKKGLPHEIINLIIIISLIIIYGNR